MPSVVNVGAGTGSYEPADRLVIAVEPSATMILQRKPGSSPVVQATAEALPFVDGAFAASLAILTVHHWTDRARGLNELGRVARDRVVILTFDPSYPAFWLVDRYFPAIKTLDQQTMPSIDEIASHFEDVQICRVLIPHDCTDGFLGAYWRRPAAYLDPGVRSAISAFTMMDDVDLGLRRLESDLKDGTWEKLYGDISTRQDLDIGYRLVIARSR